MILHDLTPHGLTLMDGRQCVAKAKPVCGGWLLTGYGFWWTPQTRNIFGRLSGPLRFVQTKRDARRWLENIRDTGKTETTRNTT